MGTLKEITGQGYEYLVDEATRSLVLAKFFDGQLITASASGQCTLDAEISKEPTISTL